MANRFVAGLSQNALERNGAFGATEATGDVNFQLTRSIMGLKRLIITSLLASQVAPSLAALVSTASAPPHAKLLSRADDNVPITLHISIKLRDLDQLENRLMAVSVPDSKDYGQYWDLDRVTDAFYPTPQALDTVKRWLDDAGVDHTADGSPHVRIATTVKKANMLLNASFGHYDIDGVTKLRTVEYSIPDDVSQHVELVHPTNYFGRNRRRELSADTPKPSSLTSRDPNSCTLMTPQALRELYNVHYTPDTHSGSRVGFGSFLNGSSRVADLRLYQAAFNLTGPNDITVKSINGGLESVNPNVRILEPNFDCQLLNAMSSPLPITEFVTGGSPPFIPDAIVTENNNEPYVEYYEYLMSKPNAQLPQVITNSYGEDERTVPEEYARRVCNYIGLMGLRGITVLHCTGDWGLGAACLSNDGKRGLEFDPQFPASCPYVTAVGGTQGASEDAATCTDKEVGWFASSGGFSRYFNRAWYQETAVSKYLSKHISAETRAYYAPYANFAGRGFPDISARAFYPL